VPEKRYKKSEDGKVVYLFDDDDDDPADGPGDEDGSDTNGDGKERQ
jgi:hypothetical protein